MAKKRVPQGILHNNRGNVMGLGIGAAIGAGTAASGGIAMGDSQKKAADDIMNYGENRQDQENRLAKAGYSPGNVGMDVGGVAGGTGKAVSKYEGAGNTAAGNIYGSIGQANTAGSNNIMALMGQLAAQTRGEGPSLAQGQLQAGNEAAMRQQMSMAASARGGGANQAAAAYNAQNQMGTISQQNALAAAQLRNQEMLGAQGQLAGVASQFSQQDLANRQLGLQAAQGAEASRFQGLGLGQQTQQYADLMQQKTAQQEADRALAYNQSKGQMYTAGNQMATEGLMKAADAASSSWF